MSPRPSGGEPSIQEQTPATPRTSAGGPLLSVIIPVYNEAATIDELMGRVIDAPYEKRILVVDDGSTDGTTDILATWGDHPHVTVIRHDENAGKGSAIRSALELAEGELTIIQDGDLETDPQDYAKLVAPIVHGSAQVVFGTRFARQQDAKYRQPWTLHRLGVCLLNVAVRFLYGTRLTDEACCYKVVPTSILRAMDLRCRRFEFCPEVVAKACQMNLRITEVPVRYFPRSVKHGKKLRLHDGLEAFASLWKWRNWRPEPQKNLPAENSVQGKAG